MAWKTSVESSAALPLLGNTTNDLRAVMDTGIIYRWDGAAWNSEGSRVFPYSNPVTLGGGSGELDGGSAASVYGGTTDVDGGNA